MIDSYCLIDALGCNAWSYPHIYKSNRHFCSNKLLNCVLGNVFQRLNTSSSNCFGEIHSATNPTATDRAWAARCRALLSRWTACMTCHVWVESKLGRLGPKIQNHLTRKFSKLFFCRCWRTTWSRLWCCRSGGISRNVRHTVPITIDSRRRSFRHAVSWTKSMYK